MDNLKENMSFLNEQQIKAVENTEGSLLVLAGAGSGKTRVLTSKIFYLLSKGLASPNQILAVTFTNKAANEMKFRVNKMINSNIDGWWIGTFHSISAKILRKHAEQVGLKSNFVIIDKEDQLKLINNICDSEKIDLKDKNSKYYLNCIDRFKNENQTANVVLKKANTYEEKNISKIYSLYENELLRLNCCDFGNLLMYCLYIFKENDKILKYYQNIFKYILVDEYQDINLSQQKWLKYLYKGSKNICCVGDDDQSIYSWRGAEIKNILNFDSDFESSNVIRLEQNYRSTKRILNCASSLIDFNKGRYGKKLWSNNDEGEKIEVKGFWEAREEAESISRTIESLIKKNISLNEIAILMRVAAHTRSFEERFLNIGLPYRIVGGIKFYERREIKDIIAYLRITNNLQDDLALQRIINLPKRGIGQITLKKIYQLSRKNDISMFEACKIYLDTNNKGKAKLEINNFISKLHKWNKLKKEINHIELCEIILDDSGYLGLIKKESEQKENIDSYDRMDNVIEFINSMKGFDNLEGFLEHISLVLENENLNEKNKISLMTIHSAKGLEFDNVFLIGWEEGLFPSKRSIEEKGVKGLEEERRLAYVALTRARKKVSISFVNQNRYAYASHDFNAPSRFISELSQNDVELFSSEVLNQYNSYNNSSQFYVDESEINQITPGKKRLINYNKNNLKEINSEFNQDTNYNTTSKLNEGDYVFSQKFGNGRILEIDKNTALVKFDKSGSKMIFMKYLLKI